MKTMKKRNWGRIRDSLSLNHPVPRRSICLLFYLCHCVGYHHQMQRFHFLGSVSMVMCVGYVQWEGTTGACGSEVGESGEGGSGERAIVPLSKSEEALKGSWHLV